MLQFPGYEPEFDGTVFTRLNSAGGIQIREVILPSRYQELTSAEIAEYLQSACSDLQERLKIVATDDSVREFSKLEEILRRLPPEIITKLSRDAGHLTEHALRLMDVRTADPGSQRQYFQVKYGLISEKMIQGNRQAGIITGPEWYGAVLDDDEYQARGLGERMSVSLLLQDGLPDQEAVHNLLSHGPPCKTATVDINREIYNRDTSQELIDAVYLSPEDVHAAVDTTQNVLERYAMKTVIGIGAIIQSQAQRLAKLEQPSSNIVVTDRMPT